MTKQPLFDIAVGIELKNNLVAVVDKRANPVDGSIAVAIELSSDQPVEDIVRISHLLLLDVRSIEISHAD